MELNIIFLKCYYVAILVRLKKDKKPKVSINGRELADIPTSFSFFVYKKQFFSYLFDFFTFLLGETYYDVFKVQIFPGTFFLDSFSWIFPMKFILNIHLTNIHEMVYL